MLSSFRAAVASSARAGRSFSTSTRRADMAKLTLIGTLTKDPESRLTKNDREYVMYFLATRNSPPPPDANGERRPSTSTYHRILSFNDHSNRYLQTLKKGSLVYVETSFELREPAPEADPTTPQGQRQILLKHENIKVLRYPKVEAEAETSSEEIDS